jgi:hypothetical protein
MATTSVAAQVGENPLYKAPPPIFLEPESMGPPRPVSINTLPQVDAQIPRGLGADATSVDVGVTSEPTGPSVSADLRSGYVPSTQKPTRPSLHPIISFIEPAIPLEEHVRSEDRHTRSRAVGASTRTRRTVQLPEDNEQGKQRAGTIVEFPVDAPMRSCARYNALRSVLPVYSDQTERSPSPVEGGDDTPPLTGINRARVRDSTPAPQFHSVQVPQYAAFHANPDHIGTSDEPKAIVYIPYTRREYGAHVALVISFFVPMTVAMNRALVTILVWFLPRSSQVIHIA